MRLHAILQPRGVRFLEVVAAFKQRHPSSLEINSRTHMYLLMKAKVTHGIDLNYDRLKKIMK